MLMACSASYRLESPDVQNVYSFVSREDEDLLTMCLKFPDRLGCFLSARRSSPGWPKVAEQPAVIGIAGRLGMAPSLVGLAWLLQHERKISLFQEQRWRSLGGEPCQRTGRTR